MRPCAGGIKTPAITHGRPGVRSLHESVFVPHGAKAIDVPIADLVCSRPLKHFCSGASVTSDAEAKTGNNFTGCLQVVHVPLVCWQDLNKGRQTVIGQ